ncbi:MAG: tetratricopeptide repeat protein, partial [Gemmatimonadales bacterium]
MDSELALYNRLGDLYLKQNDANRAVVMYEKAAKRYTETGFPNSSIALYNKILRSAPGRTAAYLELGKLMVERGFAAEAKKHFREYIERMDRGGKLDAALDSLKGFADSSTNTEDSRITVAELLMEAAHTDEAREQLAKLYAEAEAEG